MSAPFGTDRRIVLEGVSKFYGEVLGVNGVDLRIPAGITSLVGPNGSGKTTLMNLMTGLLRPTEGRISIHGVTPDDPEALFRLVGYCTQFDGFPRGITGSGLVRSFLRLHGMPESEVLQRAERAIARVGLEDAAGRRVAGYSKGMRQRIKLAQAIAHEPEVLILDEPLNGLDPMARAAMIRLFRDLAERDLHLVISSHILHEVDIISDNVVMMNEGYVVAEGDIREVRREMHRHPLRVLVRCSDAPRLAALVIEHDGVTQVSLHADRGGLLVATRDADAFFGRLNRLVVEHEIEIEQVSPADEDAQSVYEYLIGTEKAS